VPFPPAAPVHEALATRHRLRAIEDRWIPRLEQALAEVTLALEDLELADAIRLRLAGSPGRAVVERPP
jgi:V/A-type H+-transporting ATPase subunit D